MSETTKKLLELISAGKTLNEISDLMGISHKRLFNYLTMIRNKGFDFDRKYYDTGDIIYVPKKGIVRNKSFGVGVITDINSYTYSAMVISDIHFRSCFEIERVMDRIYNFCIKEGIHNIILTGDILDGTFSKKQIKKSNSYEQIEYFLKIYPFDKNIINFVLLGDHDYSILKDTGQDFSMVLDSYRHDIVNLGYGFGRLFIKNDSVGLKHSIKKCPTNFSDDDSVLLLGHTHNFKVVASGKKNYIYVPSLSNLCLYNAGYEGLPSVLLFKILFEQNVINTIYVHQLVVLDKIYFVNESVLSVASVKKGNFGNIEDYSKVFKK